MLCKIRLRRAPCATPVLGIFPARGAPLVPSLDRMSRRWLVRSRSPYVQEIAPIAEALDFSGVWLLNASMQWGCTSLACEQDGAPWLVRTLDWPFEGLGQHTELAHMSGEAGDFVSVTWPGYVGVLTAMAPHALPAGSIRRRCGGGRAIGGCGRATSPSMPRPFGPASAVCRRINCCVKLSRSARLSRGPRGCWRQTPLSRSVIYTLAGYAADERCVIEPTETDFVTRDDETSAANDWVPMPAGLGRADRHPPVPGELFRGGGEGQPARRELARRYGTAPWLPAPSTGCASPCLILTRGSRSP